MARDLDELESLIAFGPAAATAIPATPGAAITGALEPPAARHWRTLARPEQLQVADSTAPYTFFLAGRGAGKTWTAANALVDQAIDEPGYYAVVAPTFGDCRALCVEGPSGLLKAMGSNVDGDPTDILRRYDKSKYELHMRSGSVLVMASDEAPKRLRGPNFTGAWCDEPGSWRNVAGTWDEGVEFSTRLGSARKIITGTPKRGHALVKDLHRRGTDPDDPTVLLVRGSTMDNAANLSPTFLATIQAKYENTTLGRQELDGELLADAEGAVVTTHLIDITRVRPEDVPELHRVVVAVDPAVTSRATSDHTGIVVVGIGGPPGAGYTGTLGVGGQHAYLLADESMRGTPEAWAHQVLKVAEMWAADAIVAEVNQGGDLVETMLTLVSTIHELRLPRYIAVRAAVNKRTRAEPVAGVWEQARVHVVGKLPDLEDQWAGWEPGSPDSPDNMDASVWGVVGVMPSLAINAPTTVKVLNGRNGFNPAEQYRRSFG